jgi:hypothetical protein
MKKALRVFLIGVIIFFTITPLTVLLTAVKAWERDLHFNIWIVLPIACKFGLYGAIVIMAIVSMAKFKGRDGVASP